MKADRLADLLLTGVAFDVETHKIQPGLLVPPLVCGSVASWISHENKSVGKLFLKQETLDNFQELLDDEGLTIVGANIAYDMAVMINEFALRGQDIAPQVFRAYEAGRVFDLQVAEALHAIANGHLGEDPRTHRPLRDPLTGKKCRYSLSMCLDLVLNRKDAKVNDRFRQSYALLENVPLDQWPLDARTYPVDDACNTLDVALAQAGLIPRPSPHVWSDGSDEPCAVCGCPLMESGQRKCTWRRWASDNLHDLSNQCYAAFAMHLGAVWGFAVDVPAIEALETRVVKSRAAAIDRFVELGYLRPDPKIPGKVIRNSSVLKRSVAQSYGCTSACGTCAGTGKVPSAKSGKPVGCRMCDSTGLDLDGTIVPRTKGSKCRTCRGQRSFSAPKPASKRAALTAPAQGTIVPCKQCEGQPDVQPGCAAGRDVLYESGDDDVLVPFAEYLLEAKIIQTYIPFLKRGITDDGRVEVDFDLEDDDEESEGGDE